MNFIEAIKLADRQNKKIRRSFWAKYHWIEICRRDQEIEDIRCNIFPFIDENGFVGSYFTIEAMLAEDWEIYKEEPQPEPALCTFEEAVVALKAGKKIGRAYKYADHKIGWDNKFVFEEEDLFAKDWIIEEKL